MPFANLFKRIGKKEPVKNSVPSDKDGGSVSAEGNSKTVVESLKPEEVSTSKQEVRKLAGEPEIIPNTSVETSSLITDKYTVVVQLDNTSATLPMKSEQITDSNNVLLSNISVESCTNSDVNVLSFVEEEKQSTENIEINANMLESLDKSSQSDFIETPTLLAEKNIKQEFCEEVFDNDTKVSACKLYDDECTKSKSDEDVTEKLLTGNRVVSHELVKLEKESDKDVEIEQSLKDENLDQSLEKHILVEKSFVEKEQSFDNKDVKGEQLLDEDVEVDESFHTNDMKSLVEESFENDVKVEVMMVEKDVKLENSFDNDVEVGHSLDEDVKVENSFVSGVTVEVQSNRSIKEEESSITDVKVRETSVKHVKLEVQTDKEEGSLEKDVKVEVESDKDVKVEEFSDKDIQLPQSSEMDVKFELPSDSNVKGDDSSNTDVKGEDSSNKDVKSEYSSNKTVKTEDSSNKDVKSEDSSNRDVTSEDSSNKDVEVEPSNANVSVEFSNSLSNDTKMKNTTSLDCASQTPGVSNTTVAVENRVLEKVDRTQNAHKVIHKENEFENKKLLTNSSKIEFEDSPIHEIAVQNNLENEYYAVNCNKDTGNGKSENALKSDDDKASGLNAETETKVDEQIEFCKTGTAEADDFQVVQPNLELQKETCSVETPIIADKDKKSYKECCDYQNAPTDLRPENGDYTNENLEVLAEHQSQDNTLADDEEDFLTEAFSRNNMNTSDDDALQSETSSLLDRNFDESSSLFTDSGDDLGDGLPISSQPGGSTIANWKVGYLQVKLPHKSKGRGKLKAWQKRWVVIQADEFANDPKNCSLMLSVYHSESGNSRRHSALFYKSVSGKKAVLYRSASRTHPYAFSVAENDNVLLHMAADNETTSQEWISAIRNILWPPSSVLQLEKILNGNQFEVSIVDNDFSHRAGLLGAYGFLTVTSSKLILRHPQTDYVIQEWYLNTVDKLQMPHQLKEVDNKKVFLMTTSRESSTGFGTIKFFCNEAVQFLQSVASTIQKVLQYHSKGDRGLYKRELDDLAHWLTPQPSPTTSRICENEDYYKVPPRQVRSLLDIPNFIFDKPIEAIIVNETLPQAPAVTAEQKLQTTTTCASNFSQDSGISLTAPYDDIQNGSLTSFAIGEEVIVLKARPLSSESETPPTSPSTSNERCAAMADAPSLNKSETTEDNYQEN